MCRSGCVVVAVAAVVVVYLCGVVWCGVVWCDTLKKTVCMDKTSPCVPTPRPHVGVCRYTRGLLERAHGDAFDAHTAAHLLPNTTQPHTATHNNEAQHN